MWEHHAGSALYPPALCRLSPIPPCPVQAQPYTPCPEALYNFVVPNITKEVARDIERNGAMKACLPHGIHSQHRPAPHGRPWLSTAAPFLYPSTWALCWGASSCRENPLFSYDTWLLLPRSCTCALLYSPIHFPALLSSHLNPIVPVLSPPAPCPVSSAPCPVFPCPLSCVLCPLLWQLFRDSPVCSTHRVLMMLHPSCADACYCCLLLMATDAC